MTEVLSIESYRRYLRLLSKEELPAEADRIERLRKRAFSGGDGARVAQMVERQQAITEEISGRKG